VPGTIDLLHELPLRLVTTGLVDGLRVDHVDGLADPAAYLERLRADTGPSTWLLVEKILRSEEDPRPWPIEGSTGYEVADLLGGWLTDPDGARVLHEAWAQWTDDPRTYDEVALAARREVLTTAFTADVERVVDALATVCERRRRHRDHSRAALRAVVTELALHLPVYRTYVAPRPEGGGAAPADLELLEVTADAARRAQPTLDPELVDLVVGVLAGVVPGEAEAVVITRFQQLTGPVAAKGEEDTAFYRFQPLPHRCEVGADPARPTVTAADWHEACRIAQERWPQRLTTLSTHDTKRSADARARLAALSADPHAVVEELGRWWRALDPHRSRDLDPATGWSVFHLLVAAWPLELDRAWPVALKSAREAGVRTSWTRPDEAFEHDLRRLVEGALHDGAAWGVVDDLVQHHEIAADEAALAQLLAQLLAPGVPDVFQGGEGWDRSLVDPDNRRPVDPDERRALLTEAGTLDPADVWAKPELRRRGLPRTVVLRAALAARRRHAAAVGPGPAGAYVPIAAEGDDRHRVLAFGRGEPAELLVVVARPGPAPVDAVVVLPPGRWVDAITGTGVEGRVPVRDLLDAFPVALLER
jgi:(1->4)-alpha-D-glucan 1-alpha-D-glucosylmutase